jgi:hypothetical protein
MAPEQYVYPIRDGTLEVGKSMTGPSSGSLDLNRVSVMHLKTPQPMPDAAMTVARTLFDEMPGEFGPTSMQSAHMVQVPSVYFTPMNYAPMIPTSIPATMPPPPTHLVPKVTEESYHHEEMEDIIQAG